MKLNTYLKDLIALGSFFLITYLFWGPLFSGNILVQSDIQQYNGMASEIKEYRSNGEKIHWTNSGYGGMPTYLLGESLYHDSDLPGTVNKIFRKVFPGMSGIFLIGLLCFYILMRALKVNHWLAILGSFLFMAGSFSIQSFVAGHNSKMNAFAYAPLILAGLIYIFKNKPWQGVFCLAFGLAAQITVNHLQITYYTFLICLVFFISELVRSYQKKKRLPLKPVLLCSLAVIVAIGVNFNKLYSVYQYADYSIRSGTSAIELEEGAESNDEAYEYATEWSYKPIESLTLLIPNFMGGSSSEYLGEKSSWYGNRQIPPSLQTNPPTYWGEMPFTGGPVYLSVVLFALFCFGLMFLKNKWKWWVIIASSLLLFLSWGKFSVIYQFFYDFVPFFDKFRTPMMALLMLSLLLPITALKGIDTALLSQQKITFKKLLIGFGIPTIIILLFGILGGGLFSFEGAVDTQLKQAGFTDSILQGLVNDRKSLLLQDSIRSLVFVLLTGGLFWLYMKKMIKTPFVIGAILLFAFLDLFLINQRYLSADNFESKAIYENRIRPNEVNREILKDKDLHYRTYEITSNPFANANTSYHHKSLGGYHAAKLQSYDDLIQKYIAANNFDVLNMLNTKYLIGQGQDGSLGYQENTDAFGNAWFVKELTIAEGDSKALELLGQVDLKHKAIVQLEELDKTEINKIDSLQSGTIELVSYHPDKLVYQSSSNQNGFGVFSEIYYQQKDGDGWVATIDGEQSPVFKTNFLLRGLNIPSGDHEIVFEYRKSAFQKRAMVSKLFSAVLLLLGIGFLWSIYKSSRMVKHG